MQESDLLSCASLANTTMHGGMSENESVKVTIKNRDGEFIDVESTEPYTLMFDTAPELPPGSVGEISGVVTKVIYDKDDHVDMLFVEDVSLTDTPDTKIKLASDADKDAVSADTSVRSRPNGSSESTTDKTTSASGQSTEPDTSHPDDSLNAIAQDLIGDTEFDLDEEDESVISDAKRKARKQQRDPAVDPKLNRR